jgi:hypothetical protein
MNGIAPYLDSIALSRHHYSDAINTSVFNTMVPSSNEIMEFQRKDILHLSCCLMKDFIGNEAEIYKYLEYASSIGCEDVGFVTLMKVNQYSEQQFVDFADLGIQPSSNMFITQNWNNNGKCRCRNYVYLADNTQVIRVYSRYYVDKNFCQSVLVFDGQNLRIGFDGQIIY